ncbi:MAG: universal stress protein [Dehalococcoidales bacterium]|nr:universal stress protein [Dehalococcoidales bacterium]
MYQKVLVPLDGSKLAENVLPHVEMMVKAGAGEVILTTVTERISAYSYNVQLTPLSETLPALEPVVKMPVSVGKMQRQGERYLNRIAKGLTKKGIKVRTSVLLGNPADEIQSLAEEEGVDLIIMSSHGRSGHSRWALGSISDKMLRSSQVPMLLVKPTDS